MTPTSLANQWVDEISRHAPELKVLVYEGWTKAKALVSVENGSRNASKKARWTRYDNSEMETDKLLEAEGENPFAGWPAFVNDFDIVIVSFNDFQNDLSIARAPVIRPRREAASKLYESINRPRSPLVSVEWARVIMDEVQLAGGGKTAEMMSLIPRASSLAVSGTPAKASVGDLIHVLR